MKFGGIEKHVERLSVGLAKKGHQVYVYTRPWYTHSKMKAHKGVHLVSLPTIKTKHLDAITHTFLASFDVLKKNYDIVHYHGVGPSLLAWIPRLFKPRTKVVVTFHCIDRQHQKWGFLARLALRLGEVTAVKFGHDTITVSKTLQMYCAEKYGARPVYIPNGIDLLPAVRAKEIKKKFGLVKHGYILFISRLVKHKGAHYLIEAFNKIHTDKKLVIAGDSAFTDSYVAKIKKMAAENPNIIFTGMVRGGSRLWRELYSNAYLMVHPSESEGLPIVILEGMSFGLAVLVSDIPENLEAIGGGHGFSFKSTNVDNLKARLEHLLHSPKLLAQVGAGARKYVVQNYNWKDIVNSVECIYKDLVEGCKVESSYTTKNVWI